MRKQEEPLQDNGSKIVFHLPTQNETVEMSGAEYIRWLCLMEAVNIAADHAEKIGINTEEDDIWIKPNAFEHYIYERQHTMKHELMMSSQVHEDEEEEKIFTGKAMRI